jgi:hypothetical protein
VRRADLAGAQGLPAASPARTVAEASGQEELAPVIVAE